ncbi:MAG: ACT domain-containing protein [Candidatus Phosphoribacter sp.]
MTQFVLTLIGDDRPGLVAALAEAVADRGGSWQQSELAHLAGKFAGIVLVDVPDERSDELDAALRELGRQGVLDVTVTRAAPGAVARVAAMGHSLTISLLGQDRPGIVHQLSAVLAGHGVSILELSTETRDAPMAGGVLFEARATVAAPDDLPAQTLTSALEAIGDELMVDIEVQQA